MILVRSSRLEERSLIFLPSPPVQQDSAPTPTTSSPLTNRSIRPLPTPPSPPTLTALSPTPTPSNVITTLHRAHPVSSTRTTRPRADSEEKSARREDDLSDHSSDSDDESSGEEEEDDGQTASSSYGDDSDGDDDDVGRSGGATRFWYGGRKVGSVRGELAASAFDVGANAIFALFEAGKSLGGTGWELEEEEEEEDEEDGDGFEEPRFVELEDDEE